MTVCAPHVTFSDLGLEPNQRNGTPGHPADVLNLNSTHMIKLQHYGIGFTAVNTWMLKQISPDISN
jgi:hypothetical protein